MSEAGTTETLAVIESLARERFAWTCGIDEDTRLIEDLGLDSLKTLEMVIEIENRFEIKIDETSEREIVTVGDLVAVIERAVDQGGASAR